MNRTAEAIYDEWLVLRCQDGEMSAFEELAPRWHPRLLRYAAKLTGRADAAPDLVQDAWLAIVRGIGRLDDPARFPAWAYRIVGHKCADWVRAQRRQRELLDGYAAKTPAQEPPSGDEPEAVAAALNRLSLEHRTVIALHYLEDLSIARIAGMLGVPEGTIKSRLHHARHQLKPLLTKGG